jgi:hypothetical protein
VAAPVAAPVGVPVAAPAAAGGPAPSSLSMRITGSFNSQGEGVGVGLASGERAAPGSSVGTQHSLNASAPAFLNPLPTCAGLDGSRLCQQALSQHLCSRV